MFFNELLWLGFAFLDLSIVIIIFRFFGKTGLFAMIVMNVIICNIQVIKVVDLFGLTATLGNVLYGGIFLVTDILNEFYGKAEAKKAILLGFITLVLSILYMQISLLYIPAESDFIQPHMEAIFSLMPRIAIASLIAYIISQNHDIWSFHFWRSKTKNKFLWLRNNASTLISQFLDTLVFCSIAFINVFKAEEIIQIFISTYILKAMVALLDTPFIYISRYIYKRVMPS